MSIDWYSLIQKQMGEHVKLAADMEDVKKVLYKCSSPSLNWALGGGLAGGKVLTCYGPESTGKSLIGYDFIAQLHAIDPEAFAILYDAEFSFNKVYAANLGVDIKRLIVAQSNNPNLIFDHFYDVVFPMLQEGMPLKMMMIDSIKSIRGSKEAATKSVEDHVMADLPILLGKASRKLIEPIRKYNIGTILVQQVNQEMDPNLVKYQNKKWNVPNGQAMKHWSDYMVLLEKIERKDAKMFDEEHKTLVESQPGVQVGHMVRAKIEKNRVGAPYRIAEFSVQYGRGIVNAYQELAALAKALKVVKQPNKVMYEFESTRARGWDAFVAAVRDSGELQASLAAAIDSELTDGGLTFDPSEGSDVADVSDDMPVFEGVLLGEDEK